MWVCGLYLSYLYVVELPGEEALSVEVVQAVVVKLQLAQGVHALEQTNKTKEKVGDMREIKWFFLAAENPLVLKFVGAAVLVVVLVDLVLNFMTMQL